MKVIMPLQVGVVSCSPSFGKRSYFCHVKHPLQPCADFCPTEGQVTAFSCLANTPQDTSVSGYYSKNPYVSLLIRLCNDVETNPGPGSKSPVKRRGGGPAPQRQRSRPGGRSSNYNTDEEYGSDSAGGSRGGGARRGSTLESRHQQLSEKVEIIQEQVCSCIFCNHKTKVASITFDTSVMYFYIQVNDNKIQENIIQDLKDIRERLNAT